MSLTSEKRWKRPAGPGIVLIAAAVAIAPFLVRGSSCGADFLFHFSAWHDALNSWRQGILYPHWTSSANFGAGEPRFVFYPPLTWMLGAALGAVLPWKFVPIVFNFALLAAAGLATRAFALQALTDGAATLAGCAAIFSGYTLYEIDFHGDFAALAGGFWIPLSLLFLLRDHNASEPLWKRAFDGSTLPLALVVAGAWLSNAPLGVMACYLLAAMALAAALLSRSWSPIVRAGAAIGLGLGLASFYLAPAALEQHWVDIQKLFVAPDHLIQNRWITSELASPYHSLVARKRSRGAIEAGMLAVAFGGMLAGWLLGKLPSKGQASARRWWILLALIPIAILFLMFPISLPVWDTLPRLKYLEYPWRWLVVLQTPMAIFFAWAVWPIRRRQQIGIAAACAIVFIGITVESSRHLFSPCVDAGPEIASMQAMNRALVPGGNGVGGTDEYATPPGARNELVAIGLPDACLVQNPFAALSRVQAGDVVSFYTPRAWSPELGTCEATFAASNSGKGRPEHWRIAATIDHPGYLVLRLRSYPAWRVKVNGQSMSDLPEREDGLIAVPVPQGPVDLTVDWGTTADAILGRWLSSMAILLLLGLWFLERKLRRPHRDQ